MLETAVILLMLDVAAADIGLEEFLDGCEDGNKETGPEIRVLGAPPTRG